MSSRLHQRVVDEFEEWARARGGGSDQGLRDRVFILLHGRAHYLGKPDPTRWRSGDVRELLLTYIAPRQVDAFGLAELGIETMRDYLRFLDATDRLHPASSRVPPLLRELARLGPRYAAAMADANGWWLAKRVLTAAMADGIPFGAEPDVLDAWAKRFSARDAEGRRPVLGKLVDRDPGYAAGPILINHNQVAVLRRGTPPLKHLVWPHHACDCGCSVQARFPPIALPGEAALAAEVAASGAGLLRQLATLAGWVSAAGPALDDRGGLRKVDRIRCLEALGLPVDPRLRADAPVLTRLWQMAIEFDIIQVRRTRVVLGGGAELVTAALAGVGEPEQTLTLWAELADELIHATAPWSAPGGRDELHTWLQPWAPRALSLLYAARPAGRPCDLDELTERLLSEHYHELPTNDPEVFAGIADHAVRQALASLAHHGAVAATGPAGQENPREAAIAAELSAVVWPPSLRPDAAVALTNLGLHLVRQRLLAENAHAPLVNAARRRKQPRAVKRGSRRPRDGSDAASAAGGERSAR